MERQSDPADYGRVHERVRRLLEGGAVVILPHAERRMRQRRIETPDLLHVIRCGRIVDHEKPGRFWRYRIEGWTTDGERVGCAVEVSRRLLVVTVFKL